MEKVTVEPYSPPVNILLLLFYILVVIVERKYRVLLLENFLFFFHKTNKEIAQLYLREGTQNEDTIGNPAVFLEIRFPIRKL